MFFNRHFFIMIFSLFFMGAIVWWQAPNTAVSAFSETDFASNPYTIVKSFWKMVDLRQFDLAEALVEDKNNTEIKRLKQILNDNPLLSLQKMEIIQNDEYNNFLVNLTWDSVISEKKEMRYFLQLRKSKNGWIIHSIQSL